MTNRFHTVKGVFTVDKPVSRGLAARFHTVLAGGHAKRCDSVRFGFVGEVAGFDIFDISFDGVGHDAGHVGIAA